jgi:hypothetical protein
MMKRFLQLIFSLFLVVPVAHTQLLSWAPAFPKDNDNISITLDAGKGNQGLNNYTPVSDVYIHTGVITNLSTSSSDWRYVKFNQNFNLPNPLLQATSLGGNQWRFDITNIRMETARLSKLTLTEAICTSLFLITRWPPSLPTHFFNLLIPASLSPSSSRWGITLA